MKSKPTKRRDRAPKPLLLALEELAVDESLKAPARSFLAEADFSKLKSQADFNKVFAGLLCCQQLLGPVNIRYSQTLEALRKCLVYQHKSFLNDQKQWFDTDVQRVWGEILKIMKPELSPERYKQVQTVMDSLFEGPPPRV